MLTNGMAVLGDQMLFLCRDTNQILEQHLNPRYRSRHLSQTKALILLIQRIRTNRKCPILILIGVSAKKQHLVT